PGSGRQRQQHAGQLPEIVAVGYRQRRGFVPGRVVIQGKAHAKCGRPGVGRRRLPRPRIVEDNLRGDLKRSGRDSAYGDTGNLDACVAGQSAYLDRLTSGRGITEVPCVYFVDRRVVVHVGQEDGTADDVFVTHPCRTQDGSQVFEHLLGFGVDGALDEAARFGINCDLSRTVQRVTDDYGLAVGANRGGRRGGFDG